MKYYLTLIIFYLLYASNSFARGGGAGGFGGGRGGGFGGGFRGGYIGRGGYYSYSGQDLILLITIGTFGILLLVYYLIKPSLDRKYEESPIAKTLPSELEIFFTKIFISIQDNWHTNSTEHFQDYLSPGLITCFEYQFKFMNNISLYNSISNLNIIDISLVRKWNDGDFQLYDVRFKIRCNDYYTSTKYPILNNYINDDIFAEFWTFGKNINSDNSEFKLFQITQENKYLDGLPNVYTLTEFITNHPHFSFTKSKDEGLKIYSLLNLAIAEHNISLIEEYLNDSIKLQISKMVSEDTSLYERVFLNYFEITDFNVSHEKVNMELFFDFTYRKINIQKDELFFENETPITDQRKIRISKDLLNDSQWTLDSYIN